MSNRAVGPRFLACWKIVDDADNESRFSVMIYSTLSMILYRTTRRERAFHLSRSKRSLQGLPKHNSTILPSKTIQRTTTTTIQSPPDSLLLQLLLLLALLSHYEYYAQHTKIQYLKMTLYELESEEAVKTFTSQNKCAVVCFSATWYVEELYQKYSCNYISPTVSSRRLYSHSLIHTTTT